MHEGDWCMCGGIVDDNWCMSIQVTGSKEMECLCPYVYGVSVSMCVWVSGEARRGTLYTGVCSGGQESSSKRLLDGAFFMPVYF